MVVDVLSWNLKSDMACISDKGEVLLFGRDDFQINYNGSRFNPALVEQHLSTVDGIESAVLLHYKAIDKQQYLLACLQTDQVIENANLNNHLSKHIPLAYLPNRYIVFEQFPLTVNGKIDRKALLANSEFNLESAILHQASTQQENLDVWQDNIASI